MTTNPNIPYTVSELKHLLEAKVLEIEFTKKNGEIRTMKCTHIPSMCAPTKTEGAGRTVAHDLIVVTDLNKNEWRSFNFDQITSVTEVTE